MDRRAAPRPWALFLAILMLSVPVIALGTLSSARLMPGLPLSALMFLCIAAVAFWAAWRNGGLGGMRELLGRVVDARRAKPWTWHLVSALVFPGVLLVEYVIMLAAHMPLPSPQVPWLQAPVLFALFFVAAACEEVAWSATLLEPLQARHGALGASLVIGVFGAALHAIPFAQGNPSVSWVLGQCLFTVGFRVVVVWIYGVSGHSLFAAVVCHAAYNTAWQLFPNQGSAYNPWITAGLTWVVAGVVVAIFGARTLGSASSKRTEPTPRAGPRTTDNATKAMDKYVRSEGPGLQYIVVAADDTLFEYAGGWADIQNQKAMTLDTTLMAYSMTKTFTAVAILQLAAQRKLGLDETIDHYLPRYPYHGRNITIRQLLAHTSGLPNPIPLRWAHLAEERASFDEDAALAKVLSDNLKLASEPGQKFAYSNIGYWLLGKIVEQVTGHTYADYMRANVLLPLRLSAQEMDFVIPDPVRHSNGYLAKYSVMNLMKGFVMESKFWGEYEDNWLRLKSHYLNGPAFGGLVGTARGFTRLLQDQLRTKSVLFGPETKRLLEAQQKDIAGKPIPMTLGWHIGKTQDVVYFFKEGGGGGFHSEMRLYPTKRIASVVMVNSTGFDSSKFLNREDRAFLESR